MNYTSLDRIFSSHQNIPTINPMISNQSKSYEHFNVNKQNTDNNNENINNDEVYSENFRTSYLMDLGIIDRSSSLPRITYIKPNNNNRQTTKSILTNNNNSNNNKLICIKKPDKIIKKDSISNCSSMNDDDSEEVTVNDISVNDDDSTNNKKRGIKYPPKSIKLYKNFKKFRRNRAFSDGLTYTMDDSLSPNNSIYSHSPSDTINNNNSDSNISFEYANNNINTIQRRYQKVNKNRNECKFPPNLRPKLSQTKSSSSLLTKSLRTHKKRSKNTTKIGLKKKPKKDTNKVSCNNNNTIKGGIIMPKDSQYDTITIDDSKLFELPLEYSSLKPYKYNDNSPSNLSNVSQHSNSDLYITPHKPINNNNNNNFKNNQRFNKPLSYKKSFSDNYMDNIRRSEPRLITNNIPKEDFDFAVSKNTSMKIKKSANNFDDEYSDDDALYNMDD